MITGYTIKGAGPTGMLVEYHDDRGVSYTLNLAPPLDDMGKPLSKAALESEILRHTAYLPERIDTLVIELKSITPATAVGFKVSVTPEQLEKAKPAPAKKGEPQTLEEFLAP